VGTVSDLILDSAGAVLFAPEIHDFSWVNVNWLRNPPHMDFLITLAGLGDVVGSLHAHKRVHLHPESFLNAERHIAREVRPGIQQAGQRWPRNPKRHSRRRYRQACGLDDLRANEISRMGWVLYRVSIRAIPQSTPALSDNERMGHPIKFSLRRNNRRGIS
jgi:hypothetical protein